MAENPLAQDDSKKQEAESQDSPSDYAALLRRIRDVDNLKLEIKQLQADLIKTRSKIEQLEPYAQSLEQAVAERDQQIEELRSVSGSRQLMATLKKRDETIARLQQALQAKHKELEDLKGGRR